MNWSVKMHKNFLATKHVDKRGLFVKPFQQSLEGFHCKECFYTDSLAGVCRGLHYQGGEKAANRVMHVVEGEILDFVVKFNPVTLETIEIITAVLGPNLDHDSVVIPGDSIHCHGFMTLKKATCIYFSSEEYDPKCDLGFDLFSIPYDFAHVMRDLSTPVIRSERDLLLPKLS